MIGLILVSLFLFYHILIFYRPGFFFLMTEKEKNADLGGWGRREDLEGPGGRGTISEYIACKKNLFSTKREEKTKIYIHCGTIYTCIFVNLTTLGEKKIKIYSKDFHE